VFDREDEIIPESKMAKPDNDLKKMSVYSVLDKSMNLMHAQMVKGYLQKADIIIEPRVGGFGFFDFTKAEKIIEAGRVAAKRKVPEIKRKLRIR
jgi:predicted acylesterase/phospholipase RssA